MPWDENIKTRQSHGLAIISRHPIAAHEGHALKQHPDHDEKCAILFTKLAIDDRIVDICNVHFGNSDLFSDLHIKECMAVCANRGVLPIIMGDFNNFRLQDYSASQLKDYIIGTDVAPYISMPKNDGTLDYIVTPSSMKMGDIRCPSAYVSDHRPVLANVTL